MITLPAPISPANAPSAVRGDVKSAVTAGDAETADGLDFAALMAGMLPASAQAGAVATVRENAAGHSTADTGSADAALCNQEPPAGAGTSAAAAIESALAMAAALPAPDPLYVASPDTMNAAADTAGAPPANAPPVRMDAGAPRGRNPGVDFHALPNANANATATARAQPKAVTLSSEAPAPGSNPEAVAASVDLSNPREFAQQASDIAQPARPPDLQAPQAAARATQMPAAAAAPALHSPRIDAPLGSARWGEELAGHITVLVRNATSEAEIRVAPPELGPIHARISVDNGIATVMLSAPAPETRDALEAALTTLRERLAESGLTLGEASVSQERMGRFEDREKKGPGSFDSSSLAPFPPEAQPPGETAHRLRLEGLVDLYA